MRIAVIGTGNIGTLYGWTLADAGHDVTHVVRPGTQRPPVATLDLLDERSGRAVRRSEAYPWRVEDRVPAQSEVVLAALPASSLRDAVAPLRLACPEATILTWALEWAPVDLSDLVDAERLVMGYPDSGGTRTGVHYVTSLGAEPHLGLRATGGSEARRSQVIELLRSAGLTPVVHDRFEDWLRVHCALTVPFIAALAEQPGQDLAAFVRDRRAIRAAFADTKEMLRRLAAAGVDVNAQDPTRTSAVPLWLFPFVFQHLYRTNEGMRRASAHSAAVIGEGVDLAREIVAQWPEAQLSVLRGLLASSVTSSTGAA